MVGQGNGVAYAKEYFGFVKVDLEYFEAVWLLRRREAKDCAKQSSRGIIIHSLQYSVLFTLGVM